MDRLPAQRCRATKLDGTPCRKWALRGAPVCRTHGGSIPAVRQKAAERVALYEALQTGPRRPVWQVLLDVVHAADVIKRNVEAELAESETVSPELFTRFVEAIERAGRMAKVALDARADERLVEQGELEVRVIGQAIMNAIRSVQLDEDTQYRVTGAIGEALRRLDEWDRQSRPETGLPDRALTGQVVA
jgi:hypothetical protein